MDYRPVISTSHILTPPHSSIVQSSSARGDVFWSSTLDGHGNRKVVLRVASSVVVETKNMISPRYMFGEEFAIYEKRSKNEKTLIGLKVYKLDEVELEVLELKKGDGRDVQGHNNVGRRADSITPWMSVQELTSSLPNLTPRGLEQGAWPDNQPTINLEASKRKRSGTDELSYQETQVPSPKKYTSSGRARMDPELERHRVVPDFDAGPKFTPINRMPVHTAQPFDNAARKNGSFGSFSTPNMHIEHTVHERTSFQAQPELDPVPGLTHAVQPGQPKEPAAPTDVSRITVNRLLTRDQLPPVHTFANTPSRITIGELLGHDRLQSTSRHMHTGPSSNDEKIYPNQTGSSSERPHSASTHSDGKTLFPRSDDSQDTDAELLRQFGDKSALAGTPFALGKSDLKDLTSGKLVFLRKFAAENAHRSSNKWVQQHGPGPVTTGSGGAIDQNTLASSDGAHKYQQPTPFFGRTSTLPPLGQNTLASPNGVGNYQQSTPFLGRTATLPPLPDDRPTLANATEGQRLKVKFDRPALPNATQESSSASDYYSANQLNLAPMRGLSTGTLYVGNARASGPQTFPDLPSLGSLQLPEAKGPSEDLMVHDELWAWEGLPARFFKPRRRDWGFSGKGLNRWMKLDLMRGVETADGPHDVGLV
ncbi:uncharacterized protein MYCGRDRAFT_93512 [Zymoseptoria tritici IPO323]|uniref:Uncharacterized protein n=1 Tax=Zymoseptoria tritici (strain CBS 115943 / IPO323) TaxID=336722 RepID=F9XCF2_ZYMTI|nr:uncharacterized protein MYCGRDRAFT_93512 [Zymoseptoria tritici IPO323]EGP87431.1 hypothetical protein MYCGRDRAFT_93512 [Zymoseptoria tritici IPO323]